MCDLLGTVNVTFLIEHSSLSEAELCECIITTDIIRLIMIACPPQLFKDDIMYLLTMDKLWKKRKAPTPLDWQQLENSGMFVKYFCLRSF